MFKQTLVGVCFAFLLVVPSAQADILTFDLSMEFSGGTPPAGTAPWLRAEFNDFGSPGYVRLTMTALNLTNKEFVSKWYFNLDPVMDPTSLTFWGPYKTGSFNDPVISTGIDAFKADGDGKYDIKFRFATGGGAARRFTDGDVARYWIYGAGVTASSFDYLSAPAGGHGPFPTAAHVQGIGPCGADSGWVTVPEPMTIGTLGLGGLTFLVRRRRSA